MKKGTLVIGVVNSKGGVGKSTIALHVAMTLYNNPLFNPDKKENRVIILDTDDPQFTLSNVKKEEKQMLDEALESNNPIVNKIMHNEDFMPLQIEEITLEQVVKNIEVLKANYDFIIVDVVGTINNIGFNEKLFNCFDFVIVPTSVDHNTTEATVKFVNDILKDYSKKCNFKYSLLFNNVSYHNEPYSRELKKFLVESLEFPFFDVFVKQAKKYCTIPFFSPDGIYSSLIYKEDDALVKVCSEMLNKIK